MLIIKKSNLDALKRRSMESYVERMCQHISTLYPEFFYQQKKADVCDFIEETILKASQYGLSEEYAVTRFLDYRLLLGFEFELLKDNKWILDILTSKDYPELDKIATIDRIKFSYILQR